MSTWEMITVRIVFQEKRFKVGECVFLTEDAPYAILIIYVATVELMCLQFLELTDQLFINGEVLFAISPWGLVLMAADTFSEEVRHLEVRVAE